jgi:glycine betaine/proline transport system substrate-binding protein
MSSSQLAHYAALESRVAEPYTVAGYLGVEFIARAYEKAATLDANKAAKEAREAQIKTIIGEASFDAQAYLKQPKIHFFQVQGRLFKESFARDVSAGAKLGKASPEAMTTLLKMKFASGKQTIVFAGLNWASAQFGNSIARFIIESGFGYPTHSVYGSSVPLFQSLRKGDVHVFMEGWLPNMQELYEKAIATKQIADIGLLYGDAVQGWFVPNYVVAGDKKRGIRAVAPDLKSVSDLAQYRHVFASKEHPGLGRLMDGSSGWFSYKINCMKLKAYRLDDKYAQITTGSEGALFNELSTAYEKGTPILTYMYTPTWPMAKFDLQQLKEPDFTQEHWNMDKGCAYPLSMIRKWVHTELPGRAPEVVEFLEKLRLDLDEISRILLAMKEKGLKPEETALDWLRENEDVWTNWVAGDVAQRVKQALSS